MAEFGALICDDYGAICDCCDRVVPRTRGSIWHGKHAICTACFAVWYDEGETDPDEIKRKVLAAEAAGTFPFGLPFDGDRVPI